MAEENNNLLIEDQEPIPYSELVETVNSFREQLNSLDYRVTNKNFGSKIYQAKETIASKGRLIAGADDDVVILDGQNPTWRIWAGAKDPLDAPFRVDKNGNMVASSVTLSGYLAVGEALGDIGAGGITSTYIDDLAITTPKLAANAVTATKINVASLSAISANIGTVTAGTITGVTITGGTIQTSSSGLRTVLGGGDDRIKFQNGATVYASIRPYVFSQGNGLNAETLSGDAFLFIQEGTTNAAGIGITGYGIFIEPNDIQIDGDTTFYDDVDIQGSLSVVGSMSLGGLTLTGNLSMSAYDITCDDINADVVSADIIQLSGGGYVDNARAIYMDTGFSTNPSVSGEIRYYDGGSKGFRGYVNGFRGQFDMTAV